MRVFTMSALALTVLLAAPKMFARELAGYDGPDQQETYDVCQGTMDPETCMGSPMGNGGLVITACEANGTAMCTRCQPLYSWNGTLIGEECAQTKENANCKCSKGTRGGCSTQGQCTYNGFYWH